MPLSERLLAMMSFWLGPRTIGLDVTDHGWIGDKPLTTFIAPIHEISSQIWYTVNDYEHNTDDFVVERW